MADLSISNTFTPGTTIASSKVNQNFDDVKNYINDRNDGLESWDKVSIAGGLHLGGTADPGAGNLIVDGTATVTGQTTLTGLTKTVAGVHVGGTSDPGADNLLVDGTVEVTGTSTFTGLLKTVGGVHVGGTSDPGTDNLLVDGTLQVTGETTLTGLTKTVGGVHVGGTTDPGADNLMVDGRIVLDTGSEVTLANSANNNIVIPLTSFFKFIGGGGSCSLTGMVAAPAGTMIFIGNWSALTITIAPEDAGSTAANRFSTPGSTPYTWANSSILGFIYLGTTNRWALII